MRLAAAIALVLALWCAPAAAHGQRADADLERYVQREYGLNRAFVAVGALSVGTGAWLLTRDDDLSHGVAAPLLIVGAVQLVVGAVYLGITPGFHSRATRQLAENPGAYGREEGARVRTLEQLFPWFLAADAAVVVAGAVLLGIGLSAGDAGLTGAGAGSVGAGMLELALDGTARGVLAVHAEGLRRVHVSASPWGAGLGGVF